MAEEVNLIVNVDKGNTKSVADVRKELEEAKKAATDTGKALGDGIAAAETKTISLKAQLKAMKQELLTLDSNDPKFKKLAREAGELQDRIGDVNERVKALASDTKRLDSLVRIGGAITGGFQAAQGAMALFGTESKQVEKAIQNIIAAQGIMNGVQQVGIFLTTKQNGVSILDTTIKYANAVATKVVTAAQWLWNAALTANPIGLVVVAVGALSFGIYKLAKGLKDGTITIQDINKVLWRMIMPLQLIVDLFKYLYDEATKTESALEKGSRENTERFNKRLAEIRAERAEQEKAHTERQEQFDRQIARYEAEGKSSYALRLAKLEDIKAEKESILQSTKEIIQNLVDRYTIEAQLRGKSLEEFLSSIGLQYDTQKAFLENSLKDQEEAIYDSETEIKKLKYDAGKEANEAANKALSDRIKLEQDQLKNLQQQYNDYLSELENAENDYYESQLSKQDQELRQVEEKYFDLIERGKQFGIDTATLEEARLNELNEIKMKYALEEQAILDKADEDKKKKADDDIQLEKEKQAAKEKIARDFTKASIDLANTIFVLTNSLGKQDEANRLKRAKRQFEISKAMSIAEATISTIKGVVNALSEPSLLPFPLSAIAKGANALAVGAAGALNVSKIASQKFEGGGSGAATSLSSGGDVGSAMQKTGEQQPKVQDLNNSSTILNPEPQKVYVVESEMTAKQNKVKAIISEATF